MISILKNWLLPVLILSLLILFTFSQLMNSFYEQEEWLGLGNVFINGSNYIFSIFDKGFFRVITGDGRILSSFITYFFYGSFPFNTVPITIFALTMHLINTVLVFFLCNLILRKVIPSLIGAGFFAVNAVSHSAVSWSAAISTLPATTLILAALFTFLKSINFQGKENNRDNRKWMVVTFLLLYLSLLFKQIGIFLFALLPLAAEISKGDKFNIKKGFTPKSKIYVILLVILFVIIGFYLWQLKQKTSPNALFITGSSQYFYETLITRSILYPLTSFSLIFVPPGHFLEFGRYITNIYYPFIPEQQFILIAQTVVLDLLAIILTVMILGFLYKLSQDSPSQQKRVLWFFIMFIILSFLPYSIITKSFAYLDSRYYYLASVGAGFILAWILFRVKSLSRNLYIISIILAMLLVIVHADAVRKDIEKQSDVSLKRKVFLSQLERIKPALENNKNVFYITGSNDFYLSGHKVPFQNGMGHTLAVWYYASGNIPKELIKSGDLFEIGKQGYFEYGGKGFGYFSDLDKLRETMKDYDFEDNSIIMLYYNAEEEELRELPNGNL